jgi:hypothetical protein
MIKLSLIVLAFAAHANAGTHLRYFETAEGASKIWLLETGSGEKGTALFKWSGSTHPDAEKVFLFEKKNGKDFYSVGHATSLALLDYDTKTLYKGTLQKTFQLVGTAVDKTIHFVELPAAGMTAAQIQAAYTQSEGLEKTRTQAQAAAEAANLVKTGCGFRGSVQIDANFNKTDRPALGKAVAAARGLSDICLADKDYKDAVGKYSAITVSGAGAGDVKIEKRAPSLMIQVPSNLENTSAQVARSLKDNL